MMKKVAKTIVFLLWCVCVASIIAAGLAIYAFVQLVGFSEPSADLVYAIWTAVMVYHLCYDKRGWARLILDIRDRLRAKVRASIAKTS